MEWRGVALFGCLCALVALVNSAAVPAKDTLVVSRYKREVSDSPEASSTAAPEEAATEEPTPPVKMSEMTVRSEVSLRYAHTAVVTKVRNPAKKAQEANFRVLLPETAFISGFVMILDGKPYKAYVKEKEEAKKIYTDAVESGFAAAHISARARDSNHFTVSVNIEPNTTAVFNLTYEELLVRRNNVYNHAINLHPGALVPKLTVTVHIKEAQKITALRVPELRTGNEIDATEDDAQNSMAVISRGHDDREATITFSPDLDQQKNLMQIYAEKTKKSQSSSYRSWRFEEQPAEEGMLGQFVVQYDVDRPKEGEILVNDGYFVHFFAPSDLPPLNKQVVFVLDTSGSMMGTKIKQLIEAMQTILSELNHGDYFSIVEFASSVKVHDLKDADKEPPKKPSYYQPWDEKPTYLIPPSPATADNIERAKALVRQLTANGGTNIAKALDVAVNLIQRGIGWEPTLENGTKVASTKYVADEEHDEEEEQMPVAEASTATTTSKAPPTTSTTLAPAVADNTDESKKLEPIIIFLTDGDPTVGETRPQRIINRLVEKNSGRNKAAIFSLAFGEDADRDLLRKLSLRNDGFMRHIYEAADAALQLRDFYRQVSSPLLADVHFNYPKAQIKEGSLTKNKFRTYYSGSETVVAGKLESDVTELTPKIEAFCGVDDHNKRKKYEISPMVPVNRPAGEYLPLERLWAYLTIKQLLDEKDRTDESADKDKPDSPEKKALEIALKYEFVTPLTSLVVVKPNATSAVDAESVDKQPGSMPVAFGLPGLPGPPGPGFPQLAFRSGPLQPVYHLSASLSHPSGHGHVASHSSSYQSLRRGPSIDLNKSINYPGTSYSTRPIYPSSGLSAGPSFPSYGFSRKHSYPKAGHLRGHSYPSSGVPAGHSYLSPGVPAGHSYPSPGVPAGHSYPSPGVPAGHSYPSSGVSAGHIYPSPGLPARPSYPSRVFSRRHRYPKPGHFKRLRYPSSWLSTTPSYPSSGLSEPLQRASNLGPVSSDTSSHSGSSGPHGVAHSARIRPWSGSYPGGWANQAHGHGHNNAYFPTSPPSSQAFVARADEEPQAMLSEDLDESSAVVSTPRLPPPLATRPPPPPLPPATSPAPANPLQPYYLEHFQWVLDALKADNDSISFGDVTLDLVRDTNVPKEASDAECQKATDGSAGVCVYLTRCDAAKSITLDAYKSSFCRVDNHYAGVCCPKAQVDVIPSKES